MTRGEMMRRMSAREYDDWMAYMQLYPIGDRAADLRILPLTLAVINSLRDAKRHPSPYEPGDVFPWFATDEPEPETPEQTYARMVAGLSVGGHTIIKTEA